MKSGEMERNPRRSHSSADSRSGAVSSSTGDAGTVSRASAAKETAAKSSQLAASAKEPSAELAGEDIYQAEGIIGKQVRRGGQIFYRVKWLGYPVSQSTWEPLENIGHCFEFIDAYERRTAAAKPRRRRRPRDDEEESSSEAEEDSAEEVPRPRSAGRARGSRRPPPPALSPGIQSPEREDTFGAPAAPKTPAKRPRVLSSSSSAEGSPPPKSSAPPAAEPRETNGETPEATNSSERDTSPSAKRPLKTERSVSLGPERGWPAENPNSERDASPPAKRTVKAERSVSAAKSVGTLPERLPWPEMVAGPSGSGKPPTPTPEPAPVVAVREVCCGADLDDHFVYWRPFPSAAPPEAPASSENEASRSSRLDSQAADLRQWQSRAVAVVGIQFAAAGAGLEPAVDRAFVHFRAAADGVPPASAKDFLQAFPLALVRQYLPEKLLLYYQSCASFSPRRSREAGESSPL
ncbi:chromo domain-containing protein cec-1-like [Paramacrobiotus metropolitanus]|uniref:chromo domain-containing protein cec-1-like n=1 Tax=Paramacrobiotus metropolitanus TaxID=2943436 RepID=UPI002445A4C0|nr:chromo domain-containing protein cec-1-like [Paramacrobiotus metropolitanus]